MSKTDFIIDFTFEYCNATMLCNISNLAFQKKWHDGPFNVQLCVWVSGCVCVGVWVCVCVCCYEFAFYEMTQSSFCLMVMLTRVRCCNLKYNSEKFDNTSSTTIKQTNECVEILTQRVGGKEIRKL